VCGFLVPCIVHSLLLALVTFVSPAAGSQAIGPTPLEITTTISNVDRVEFYVDDKLAGVARKSPYRITHDFGTSLDAHNVSAKVFSDGYKNVETAHIATAAFSAGETISVDLVEVHGLGLGRRVDLDRHRHEAEGDRPVPDRACGHGQAGA